MNDFSFYFGLGWQHIISLDAADHILFIVALTAIYQLKNWKQVLVLVTAFTIGHSLTLALSVYDVIRLNSKLVEFLIPLTIMTTAFSNIFQKDSSQRRIKRNYFFALFFGLIHGLGFANTIRFLLAKNQGIGVALFSFNIGLEAGQIVIVALILLLCFVLVNKFALPVKWWIWSLSFIAFSFGTCMAFQRNPF